MKKALLLISVLNFCLVTKAQTPITAVSTSTSPAPSSFTYSNAGITYNWGLAPNNNRVSLDGFTAGGVPYSYASFLTGIVSLRRVNNTGTSGNYTLVWAEVVDAGSTYNVLPEYQNDMEPFFNNRIYNKGSDNFFDNTSANSNNIERMDWVITGGYSTASPARVGFAVFERGAAGAHDPFCIAAITAIDGLGNPTAYSSIVRVAAANYGDPGPAVTYRVLKAQNPSNLLTAANGNQNRGGVIVSMQSLGITAGQTIYGYSLFSNDLPLAATPLNLVNFNDNAFFPTATGNPGGIDLIAVTGIYIETAILPVTFTGFWATENQGKVQLNWNVENEISVNKYEVERSLDGVNFSTITSLLNNGVIASSKFYTHSDNISVLPAEIFFYRIKQIDYDGKYKYSNTIAVRTGKQQTGLTVYPNPVQNNLFINISNSSTEQVVLRIINSEGKNIITKNIQLSAGNNSVAIPEATTLPAGMYHLIINSAAGKSVKQSFIKN